ncbi:MAG: bifunctional methylenetetrahydrofolate dehydrogenase/methenyltetrahydrofolate cyclohydrolase [Bdellovibrionota bacterium]
MAIIDVDAISQLYRQEVKEHAQYFSRPLRLLGILATESGASSKTYASYAKIGARDVGVEFVLREFPRIDLESAIIEANRDSNIDGIMVYYPIFSSQQDNYIKDLVDYRKDVEGLNSYWIRKLYANDRTIDGDPKRRSVLPCTPLAIVKILEEVIPYQSIDGSVPLKGKKITIFNRSEVVGRPLAAMLANDGAAVYSFDIHGPLLFVNHQLKEVSISRRDAIKDSDIVIGGVPSKNFKKITADEVKEGTICVNFSSIQNFTKEAQDKVLAFAPRVGPVTISMLLRNLVRLKNNFADGVNL